MRRGILSTIHRLGKEVVIKTISKTGTDEFNNPVNEWSESRTTRCVRTYPNRNTQVESRGGEYNQDRALFIFADEEAPNAGDRIVYGDQEYELKSPTVYDTHTAIFGEPVSQ